MRALRKRTGELEWRRHARVPGLLPLPPAGGRELPTGGAGREGPRPLLSARAAALPMPGRACRLGMGRQRHSGQCAPARCGYSTLPHG